MSEWAATIVMAIGLCAALIAGAYYGGDFVPDGHFVALHSGYVAGPGQ